MTIWQKTKDCITSLHTSLLELDFDFVTYVKGIGITNQRETTVVWNAKTGIPYYNAIVWDDGRTAEIVSKLEEDVEEDVEGCGEYKEAKDKFRSRTGLPLATYFAGGE